MPGAISARQDCSGLLASFMQGSVVGASGSAKTLAFRTRKTWWSA